MKVQEKIEIDNGRVFRSYIYTREKLSEWFWIFVSEGESCPYWYLPVYRSFMRHGHYAMPTPIAPFGLLALALYAAFWSFWKDVVYIVSKWVDVERVHEARKRFFDNPQ